MSNYSRRFEFDIEHFAIHDEAIMDFSSFNRIKKCRSWLPYKQNSAYYKAHEVY